ncbi:E2 domain-associated cysteine-rich protein [Castellaniella sp.]|uniref:E2 domain-associated cysteine-rich protein n=1 Tax=Castellaniella sp. TaxID=1955812 RepID=UPI003C77C4D2
MSAVNLIERAASDFGGTCTRINESSGILELPVLLVDGRTIEYRLLLKETEKQVSVREEPPKHLPAFCPERHINYDGTFCLYYPAASRLEVHDDASAIAWVETLYKYLKLQDRAKRLRKWPNASSWAHGDAAHQQLRALEAASALRHDISNAVEQGQIILKRRKSKGRSILEIWIGNNRIFSVWEHHKRVVNQSRRCFCLSSGSRRPKRLRRCNDHAQQAAELALAIRDWEDAEQRFWDSVTGRSCCGSCDNCPLPLES